MGIRIHPSYQGLWIKKEAVKKNVPISVVLCARKRSERQPVMETAFLLRVASSQVVHIQLSTGAIVCASLSEPFPSQQQISEGAVCALQPMSVEVELGPYSVRERRFLECKLIMAEQQPARQEARTTQFRRIRA